MLNRPRSLTSLEWIVQPTWAQEDPCGVKGRRGGGETLGTGILNCPASPGHLQQLQEEERRVRGAPECHKINLSRAGFHGMTEQPAEAQLIHRYHHIWSNARQGSILSLETSEGGGL